MSVPLNILDLVPIREGSTASEAIDTSMQAARLADELGYSRLWFAEHHNTMGLAASATALLISQAASVTEKIRVGSGGVMLPNHAPLMVAEQYGTLANIHGDRIDLGLGRAPGTDGMTAQALSRSSAEPQSFAQNIYDMQGWFSSEGKAHTMPIESAVSVGTEVPIWVLGSTTNGAAIAGQLGLPFSLASHFAPDQIDAAIRVYRESFTTEAPTAQIDKPYVMAGINVLVAETDEEAEREFTTVKQMFADIGRGRRRHLQPPVDPSELAGGGESPMLRISAVGSPETATRQLSEFVERTGADELITVTYAYEPATAERSLKLLADAWF
ncbi:MULTISPECIES: LLM class flavin-dependent oxidoreductase [Brevibacterium]|uniref:LLM class flavin-dependent oxidoreductase n=4 Tax=Brevibacterium TaxID=1696 RepID=A0A1D7VZN3_BREAU|nr:MULTISPECIES: LLM class flavin-dependent oxidoreductase [Brevibacterium]AOP52180.1 Luciferase-like monooxygenase [Brevibacterium aurantiacum]AZL04566.1 LLM class flavin-dependent oxidoreductase [Brevibacterium aurantiacum]AZL11768.1 LLM class flavin-dependent oxidoreductase [Brevibacterium aurantiacum]AZT96013.1 LLM class flavin-dependent oxidoreductase [Brevibacterium aurantiacum]MDN5550389.1 LLM class flavin-dependent oxidoreductase [Brevibacterium sp.]